MEVRTRSVTNRQFRLSHIHRCHRGSACQNAGRKKARYILETLVSTIRDRLGTTEDAICESEDRALILEGNGRHGGHLLVASYHPRQVRRGPRLGRIVLHGDEVANLEDAARET